MWLTFDVLVPCPLTFGKSVRHFLTCSKLLVDHAGLTSMVLLRFLSVLSVTHPLLIRCVWFFCFFIILSSLKTSMHIKPISSHTFSDWQNGWKPNKVWWNSLISVFYTVNIRCTRCVSIDISCPNSKGQAFSGMAQTASPSVRSHSHLSMRLHYINKLNQCWSS